MTNFPGEAALAIALKTSGVENVNDVIGRLGPDDVDRIVNKIKTGSESIPLLVRQTQYAGNEITRDLLAKILRGELENPDQTPRSVAALIEKLGQRDLDAFLKLRRVLWHVESFERHPEIYCMHEGDGFPGLLDRAELNRLDELGLVGFAPVPYQSHFQGPIAQRIESFGDRKLRILSTKPDAILELGHWNLTGDGRFLISLYEDDDVELLEDQFDFNADAWRAQGFNVEDVTDTYFISRGTV